MNTLVLREAEVAACAVVNCTVMELMEVLTAATLAFKVMCALFRVLALAVSVFTPACALAILVVRAAP